MLICDMVGSTDMRVRLGADGERLVRLAETLAREAVSVYGGTYVKSLGDGAMAVFEAAADAIAAAVRLQRQIAGLHERGEAADLVIRIGISAGDVSVGPDDCYGLPVAEAVRLCAAAQGGEILVADVVKALARRLEVSLSSAGEQQLRGLHEPVVAWRVEWQQQSTSWLDVPLPPRLAVPAAGRLVGRESELGRLVADFATPGRHPLRLVAGEPGAGKSALGAEVARRLHATGSLILHGGCDEELRPPYQPFAQLLRHLVRHAPTSVLDDHVRRHGGDLAVLVPELEDRVGRLPAPRTSAQASDRYLLFSAVTGLLEAVLAQVPVVMVIDDLQWADRGTLLLLRHLLVTSQLSALSVIATMRDSELEESTALADLFAELHRVDGIDRVDLSGLDADEMRELVVQMLGDSDAAVVARAVHRETDGNPFFAIELLRHLRESREEIGVELLNALPPSVRDVVRRRVRRLGADVLRVLTAGSVLGSEFSLTVVADLAGMPTDVALDLLERATHASVLREVPGQSRFRFVHALVQHTLYDELSHARRRRLHRGAAEALERVGNAVTRAAVAAHWIAAGDLGDPLRAMAACTAAADEAMQQRAPDEASKWYGEALDLLPDDDQPLRCELLLRLGEAQRLAGDPAHRRTLLDAAELARTLCDAGRLARAALGRTRWFSSFVSSGGDPEQLDLLEQALWAIGDDEPGVRARLLATLSAELVYTDRADERFETSRHSVELARRSGDDTVLFDVLYWRAMAARLPGRNESEPELSELRALAARLNDPLRQATADVITFMRGLVVGDLARGDSALHNATALSEQLRLPVLRWLVTVLRATRATVACDLTEAEALIGAALQLSQATDQPDTTTWFGVQLYMIRYEQARLAELQPLFAALQDRAPNLYTWHAALAMARAEIGDITGAQQLVDQILAADYPARQTEPHWIIGMCCLGSTVARLGDATTAAAVYDALRPYAHVWASIMPLTLGSTDRILGELSLARGRLDDAERHFRAGIAANDTAPAPGFAARSRIGLLSTLIQSGQTLDDPEPHDLVDQVRAAADRHGLVRVAQLLDEVVATARNADAYPGGVPVLTQGADG